MYTISATIIDFFFSGQSVEKIFWGANQPNNYNKDQNCAVLDSDLDWKWNDISCKVMMLIFRKVRKFPLENSYEPS